MKLPPWNGHCVGCGRTQPEVNFPPTRRKCHGCCHKTNKANGGSRALSRKRRGEERKKAAPANALPNISDRSVAPIGNLPANEEPAFDIDVDQAPAPRVQNVAAKPDPARSPAPPMTSPNVLRVLVLADIHFPEHDPRYWGAVLAWLNENHADVIVYLGDILDQESVSRHPGNPNKPKWTEDVDYAKARHREVRKIKPDATIVYVKGNHEGWIDRYIAEVAPALEGAVSLKEALCLDEMGIKWIEEDQQPFKIGNLWLIHGHQLRGGGMSRARKLALDFGMPGVTVVMGHDHQAQEYELKNINGNCTGITLGCGRTIKPKWQKNENNGWVHQIGIFDVFPDGAVFRHTPRVIGGRLVWGDRVYTGTERAS